MTDLDRTLFLALNSPTDDWSWVAILAYVAAKFVIYLIPIHLCLLWIRGDRLVRRQALVLLTALLVGIAISYGLGVFYPIDRPFIAPLGHALLDHRPSPSFPSNHGLVFFTYAGTLALLRRRRHAAVVGAAGLVVAWSRVYLGVHFPFDMAGAALVALMASLLVIGLDRYVGLELTLFAERMYQSLAIRPFRSAIERLR